MQFRAMRRLLPIAATVFLAACASQPQQPVANPVPIPQAPVQRSTLMGLTAGELVGHFGSPALQVREGTSLKLQFRGRSCVLDAYLYPSGTGAGDLRVTHVDARAPSGADTDQAACISALENPS
jgi:hypothetical protein